MTYFDRIASQVAAAHQLETSQARAMLDHLLLALAQAVNDGEPVVLPGLGLLKTINVAERHDHHPSTGAPIHTSAARRVVFAPLR